MSIKYTNIKKTMKQVGYYNSLQTLLQLIALLQLKCCILLSLYQETANSNHFICNHAGIQNSRVE